MAYKYTVPYNLDLVRSFKRKIYLLHIEEDILLNKKER